MYRHVETSAQNGTLQGIWAELAALCKRHVPSVSLLNLVHDAPRAALPRPASVRPASGALPGGSAAHPGRAPRAFPPPRGAIRAFFAIAR